MQDRPDVPTNRPLMIAGSLVMVGTTLAFAALTDSLKPEPNLWVFLGWVAGLALGAWMMRRARPYGKIYYVSAWLGSCFIIGAFMGLVKFWPLQSMEEIVGAILGMLISLALGISLLRRA